MLLPNKLKLWGSHHTQRGPHGSTMDSTTASADSTTGCDPGKALVDGGGATSLPNHQGKVGSYLVQTFNGSQTMNSHDPGSAAAPHGGTVTSGGANSGGPAAVNSGSVLSSKGLPGPIMPPASNSVIQTPLMNSQSVVVSTQPASQTTGPTVTLVRPPVHTTTLNGNNIVVTATNTALQSVVGTQPPLVNNGQSSTSVTVSARPHIIKAEPPTTLIQSALQTTVTPGAVSTPRSPATVTASPGGIRTMTPQMLAPRLPQTSPGQPSIHNIQLPPGK